MRVFYYFQDLETNMFAWQRTHLIDELRRHGVTIDTFNPLHYNTPNEANECALELVQKGCYDLFFTNACYYEMLFVETVEAIKQKGIPTLCLRCDNLIIPYNDRILSPHFDLVWLTSSETQHLYNKWGVKSFFAPYAANPVTFAYNESDIVRRPCFVGTPYGSRSIMINTLTSNGIDVDAYCLPNPHKATAEKNESKIVSNIIMPNRWKIYYYDLKFKEGRKVLWGSVVNRLRGHTKMEDNTRLHKFHFVKPSEISAIYSSYALCMSSTSTNHTDALKHPLKIVNLRAFEVPMSGGINICKYNPELANYFEEGKEILFYETNEELVDKARYYTQKASDNEIYSIKRAARKRAENEHTWWKRFCIAFDILGLKYDK